MEETEKKKGKTWLLVLMLIIILGLASYIMYDKVFMNTAKNIESKMINNNEDEKDDITNTDLAIDLHKSLITKDNLSGLFYKDKITPDKTDDERFIRFNLAAYIYEKRIFFTGNNCGAPSDTTNEYYISKDELNAFINEKYNNNLKYDLPAYNASDEKTVHKLYDNFTFENYNGKWAITCNGENSTNVQSKMTKAEQDGEYIYIYDKAVKCETNQMAAYYCDKYLDDDSDNEIMRCDICDGNDSSCKNDALCPKETDHRINKMGAALLTQDPDSLATFKHTFKQVDGEYYWISTEVEQ